MSHEGTKNAKTFELWLRGFVASCPSWPIFYRIALAPGLRQPLTTQEDSLATPGSPTHVLKALANDSRLAILRWLKDPREHFPPQVEGDLVDDGVCGLFIAQKLGVGQPTASEHLRILVQAGLLRAKRMKQWTFYKRDEKRIAAIKRELRDAW